MKRSYQIFALLLTLTTLGCTSDTGRPEATGKGNLRLINAMSASPEVGFFIQERLISGVPYKGVSSFAQYDDLNYDFNFEVLFAGNTENTRIASRNLDVVADQDYVFLISGTVTAPALTVWDAPIRVFDANTTVFQIRLAHSAASLGAVDYYFAADGIAPVMGQAAASLSFGEISAPVDFEAGSYVVTVTSAGNPGDILYTSTAVLFSAQTAQIITPFDGDQDDNAPFVLRSIGSLGSSTTLADPSFPASVEFIHAALGVGALDIYNDEALTSRLLSGQVFTNVSAAIPVATGTNTFRYTPAGDTSVVSAESAFSTLAGQQNRFVIFGDSALFRTASYALDRTSIDTAVKIQLFQTSLNFALVDFYIVTADVLIDDELPFRSRLSTGASSSAAGIAAGSYDIYLTGPGDKIILAGPVRIDVALGDVVDMFVFDTVDPAILDLQILPVPGAGT